MSEVDRLSNSGLYPALPPGDRRGKDGSSQGQPRDPAAQNADPKTPAAQANGPRPPKSLIDEYA